MLPWFVVTLVVVVGAWIGFQLIHQNGRLLSRFESLEQRLVQLQASQPAPGFPAGSPPTPALESMPSSLSCRIWRAAGSRWQTTEAGSYC
jgi:hypothetical protein